MSRKDETRRGREIQAEIRAILEESWDPIGLFPGGPKGEYDEYIGRVYRLLASGAGELALTRYLMDTEAAILGETSRHSEAVAEAVRRLMRLDVTLAS